MCFGFEYEKDILWPQQKQGKSYLNFQLLIFVNKLFHV
jgi:hypothetical protein